MATRNAQVKLITVLGGIVLVGALAYFSMQQTQKQYEVCMKFKGASHCATSAGATSEEAIRSAQGIDCEMLSNGRDENMVCLATDPSGVRQMK
jgi:hypothetical protein